MKKKQKRNKFHVRLGDTVKIITGDEKGKIGTILQVFRKKNKVVVEGINICFKHIKPKRENESGEIRQYELPIHVSNVCLIKKNT